jgi:CheY-like chemotaxis protein
VISQQFVQLLGGNITVESELGKGSCFQFTIPVRVSNPQIYSSAIQQKEVLGLVPNQPQYRILTVDDKAINRQLLIKLLTPLGFSLKEAQNGQEAIALWESWQPHLIFMDMRMPVMDGYEATKYIKSHVKGSATVVIALTASVLEEEKAIVLSAGCDDFIRKPFKESTIFNMLRKYLGVQYIYAENLDTDENSPTEIPLTSDLLQTMPPVWLDQLLQATIAGDDKQALIFIGEIADTHTNLANILNKLVYEYEFEPIINLIEPLIKHE